MKKDLFLASGATLVVASLVASCAGRSSLDESGPNSSSRKTDASAEQDASNDPPGDDRMMGAEAGTTVADGPSSPPPGDAVTGPPVTLHPSLSPCTAANFDTACAPTPMTPAEGIITVENCCVEAYHKCGVKVHTPSGDQGCSERQQPGNLDSKCPNGDTPYEQGLLGCCRGRSKRCGLRSMYSLDLGCVTPMLDDKESSIDCTPDPSKALFDGTDVPTPTNACEVKGDPCAPPSDPNKGAICVHVERDTVAFDTGDPDFDGVGTYVPELFTVAIPDAYTGPFSPELRICMQRGKDIKPPLSDVRFDSIPVGKVYGRLYFDDVKAREGEAPERVSFARSGLWLAGFDTSQGLADVIPLVPIDVVAGKTTELRWHMSPVRALDVSLSRDPSVTPQGNGQGAVLVEGFANPSTAGGPTSVVVRSPCVDLSDSKTAVLRGAMWGTGPYYLAARLDDFGVLDAMDTQSPLDQKGALRSFSADGGIPPENRLTFGTDAYHASVSLSLTGVTPKGSLPDTTSCSIIDGGVPLRDADAQEGEASAAVDAGAE